MAERLSRFPEPMVECYCRIFVCPCYHLCLLPKPTVVARALNVHVCTPFVVARGPENSRSSPLIDGTSETEAGTIPAKSYMVLTSGEWPKEAINSFESCEELSCIRYISPIFFSYEKTPDPLLMKKLLSVTLSKGRH